MNTVEKLPAYAMSRGAHPVGNLDPGQYFKAVKSENSPLYRVVKQGVDYTHIARIWIDDETRLGEPVKLTIDKTVPVYTYIFPYFNGEL